MKNVRSSCALYIEKFQNSINHKLDNSLKIK